MDKNIRWVITHICPKYGYRTMTFAAQGRFTYETREEAERDREALMLGLHRTLGTKVASTVRTTAVECWPGHNDPKRTVFDEEE